MTQQDLCHEYLKRGGSPNEVSKDTFIQVDMCVIYLKLNSKLVIDKKEGCMIEPNKECNRFRKGKRSICMVCKIPGHNILI